MPARDHWNARYADKELVWSAGPNKTFAKEIDDLPPGKALDFACGEGRTAVYLAEKGWRVTAIDFSDVAIEKALQIADRRGVNVDWINDDVSRRAFAPGEFDLVAVLYLHTGAAERQRWLSRAIEAVAPAGTFIYIGHDPANIGQGTGGPQDPDVLPSASEIVSHLGSFVVEKAEIIERPIEKDPGHGAAGGGKALDTLVKAVRLSKA